MIKKCIACVMFIFKNPNLNVDYGVIVMWAIMLIVWCINPIIYDIACNYRDTHTTSEIQNSFCIGLVMQEQQCGHNLVGLVPYSTHLSYTTGQVLLLDLIIESLVYMHTQNDNGLLFQVLWDHEHSYLAVHWSETLATTRHGSDTSNILTS